MSANPSQRRPIGMASGVLAEFDPETVAAAVVDSGFDMAGFWVRPEFWTVATARSVRAILAGMPVLDVEAIDLGPGPLQDKALRTIDLGAELHAANALVFSSDPDMGATVAKLAELTAYAAARGIKTALEFGLWTTIPGATEALAIVEATGEPTATILPDTMHIQRAGRAMAELASIPAERLSYAQLCDAPAQRPAAGDQAGLLRDALDLRQLPGEGALDVEGFVSALPPRLPFGVELRSAALREHYPDPRARAAHVAGATRAWLARHAEMPV